jgi:hypothetical protein
MGSKIVSSKLLGKVLCVAALVVCICASSVAAQQTLDHKVIKGDTLWSISERYFGTPDFWPKLWEMNSFVTNPHLLKPGDLIRVGFKEPAAVTVPEIPKPQIENSAEIPEMKMYGIAVGGVANLNNRGLFSYEEQRPWSTVAASNSQKLLLAKGDLLYLNFAQRGEVKSGDEFMIYRLLSRVKNVVTGGHAGYFYSARAKVVLKEPVDQSIYRTEIQESYSDVMLGDLVLPFIPAPSCVTPLPSDPALRGVVVAADQLHTSFGRNSVVYLDSGRDNGLVPGSMLEMVGVSPEPSVSKVNGEPVNDEKIVGRIMVLEAEPRTASALVLATKDDLRVGTSFRGASSWLNSAGSSRILLSCPGRP